MLGTDHDQTVLESAHVVLVVFFLVYGSLSRPDHQWGRLVMRARRRGKNRQNQRKSARLAPFAPSGLSLLVPFDQEKAQEVTFNDVPKGSDFLQSSDRIICRLQPVHVVFSFQEVAICRSLGLTPIQIKKFRIS